jgi:beta-glucanase (GH16 family)
MNRKQENLQGLQREIAGYEQGTGQKSAVLNLPLLCAGHGLPKNGTGYGIHASGRLLDRPPRRAETLTTVIPSLTRRPGLIVAVVATAAVAAVMATTLTGNDRDRAGTAHIEAIAAPQSPTEKTVVVTASADTWVSSTQAKRNFGGKTYLTVRDARQSGLVRFDVPRAPGWRITRAALRLNSGTVPGRKVSVYTTSGAWAENTVAWRTAPAGGGLVSTSPAFGARQWVSWNVLPAVPPAGGAVAFRLENASHTWMGFATRESGAATAPQLELRLTRDTGTVPTVTPSASLPAWTPSATPKPATPAPSTTTAPAAPAPKTTGGSGSGPTAGTGWNQTFFDDFTGTSLSPAWGKYLGAIPSMPGGTWAGDQVQVRDGKLRLLSSKSGGRWTSGGVGTTGQGARTYGKYLVRFRMDKAPGVKYALLLWPSSGQWPMDGEIDFAEDSGGNRSGTAGTLIWGSSASSRQQEQKHAVADFSQWHTVGVEWSPGKVVFTLDGKAYGTVENAHAPSKPMNLALQTEAGSCGQWMTCADSTTPAVTALEVDWVAMYSR